MLIIGDVICWSCGRGVRLHHFKQTKGVRCSPTDGIYLTALKLFGAYATAAHVPGGELPTSLVGADDGFSLQPPQKISGNDESF